MLREIKAEEKQKLINRNAGFSSSTQASDKNFINHRENKE